MKTTFEIVDLVYKVLSVDEDVTGEISGEVYKHQRPLNSDKEDIVIGSLPVNNASLQETVVNVNVHVPNLTIGTGTVQDTTQPDTVKLNRISKLCINVLDDYFNIEHDYGFDVQQQNLIQDQGETFSNIRLNFHASNVKA